MITIGGEVSMELLPFCGLSSFEQVTIFPQKVLEKQSILYYYCYRVNAFGTKAERILG